MTPRQVRLIVLAVVGLLIPPARAAAQVVTVSIWGDYASGPGAIENNDAATAAWGHYERDYPRQAIVSPYPFKTAQAHYEALLTESRARGGPTVHTRDTLPE